MPLNSIRQETDRLQGLASHPEVSAWVSANAGTGKTYVLVQRVLRLLLSGTTPERILCLTFTKAAASEMANRLFDRLSTWATASDEELQKILQSLLGQKPSQGQSIEARRLFARALETPGGLKVQTIHAFCERLLQRFPLEAGVAPHFSVLDEDATTELRHNSVNRVLSKAAFEPLSDLGLALKTMIAYAGEERFEDIIRGCLDKRDVLRQTIDEAIETSGSVENLYQGLQKNFRKILGLAYDATGESIFAEQASLLSDVEIKTCIEVLQHGKITDQQIADGLRQVFMAQTPSSRFLALGQVLLTQDGKPRADSRFVTKQIREDRPDVAHKLMRARDDIHRLSLAFEALKVAEASAALVLLADQIMQDYDAGKAARAALDFDDLILKSAHLLSGADAARWVLYKLDGGIDHILVDEAQDTSPESWTVIDYLAEEFFSEQKTKMRFDHAAESPDSPPPGGEGLGVGGTTESIGVHPLLASPTRLGEAQASLRRSQVKGEGLNRFRRHTKGDVVRTVFAVGDEKQSIYGFQGAEPKKFAEVGASFQFRAIAAKLEWHRIPLTLSFRSTAPVLSAVDYVFAQNEALKGLSAQEAQVLHHAARDGQAGHVEIWETERSLKSDPADPWEIVAEQIEESPIARLAARIADKIKAMLTSCEILPSKNAPVQPGDILILVRKREPFVAPMIRALKARGIPVAGADRIRIMEQLAVMDLMALGDFLLMPEDDLSLAIVLKSPFFDFDDDDLFALSYDRSPKTSLWEALNKRSDLKPEYEQASGVIKQWLARADLVPPFEFFAGVLLTSERRARIISRLGPEAGDAIDEFLNMAVRYDDMAPPSLQGFLSWMRQSESEIKRDMEQGRNEVRIMTVHGAKGLEAEIVFMPDTCTRRGAASNTAVLAIACDEKNARNMEHLVWAIPGARRQDKISAAKENIQNADAEEYNRLLYVAMTRARDRLYVCGFENKRGRELGCWYDLIRNGLEGHVSETRDDHGSAIWTFSSGQMAEPDRMSGAHAVQESALEPPNWASRRAPNEPVRSIPVSPSSIVPLNLEEMEEVDAKDQPAISPKGLAEGNRFLRGTLTHALLEHLPNMDPVLWQEAATRLVRVRGGAAPQAMQDSIVRETLKILQDPEFGPLFGPESQAEVPVTARIPESETGGAPVQIAGQIDRLVILQNQILIVDYKTNRPPPYEPKEVAPSYLTQLVAYRRAISEILPEKSVRCALLWTDGPRLMEIPSQLLDEYQAELGRIGWRRS